MPPVLHRAEAGKVPEALGVRVVNGSHVDPSVKISPLGMENTSLHSCSFLTLSSSMIFAFSLWDFHGCS